MLPSLTLLATVASGFAAGLVNAVAGGGTLISFPMLLLLGLPPVTANITNNVASSGAPTDYWGQDPIAVILGQAAVNAKAPHPKAALLAVNFLISAEGQTLVARSGRLPVRAGVATVPADAITKLGNAKLYPMEYAPEDEKIWQKRFQDLIRGR